MKTTHIIYLLFSILFCISFLAIPTYAVSITSNYELNPPSDSCLKVYSVTRSRSEATVKKTYAGNNLTFVTNDQNPILSMVGDAVSTYKFTIAGNTYDLITDYWGLGQVQISLPGAVNNYTIQATNTTSNVSCSSSTIAYRTLGSVYGYTANSYINLGIPDVVTTDYKFNISLSDQNYLNSVCISVGRVSPQITSFTNDFLRFDSNLGKYIWKTDIEGTQCLSTFTTSIEGVLDISDIIPYLPNNSPYYVMISVSDAYGRYTTKAFPFGTKDTTSSQTPLYRFYSSNNKAHFYSSSPIETYNVNATTTVGGWEYEGVAYNVSDCSDSGSSKVYRFWSEQNHKHFYTISPEERDIVINKYTDREWLYEGEVFCGYSSGGENMQPVYRFWSEQNHSHFYTSSEQEKNETVAKYTDKEWHLEGVAYFVKK